MMRTHKKGVVVDIASHANMIDPSFNTTTFLNQDGRSRTSSDADILHNLSIERSVEVATSPMVVKETNIDDSGNVQNQYENSPDVATAGGEHQRLTMADVDESADQFPIQDLEFEKRSLHKNQSGGLQIMRFGAMRNDRVIGSSNAIASDQILNTDMIHQGIHANSSEQLLMAKKNNSINGIRGSPRKNNATNKTAVTQDSSHRRVFVPSTTNLDLTETQTNQTNSSVFNRKRSLPMATFGQKKSQFSKQAVTTAAGASGTVELYSSRAEQQHMQSLVVLGKADPSLHKVNLLNSQRLDTGNQSSVERNISKMTPGNPQGTETVTTHRSIRAQGAIIDMPKTTPESTVNSTERKQINTEEAGYGTTRTEKVTGNPNYDETCHTFYNYVSQGDSQGGEDQAKITKTATSINVFNPNDIAEVKSKGTQDDNNLNNETHTSRFLQNPEIEGVKRHSTKKVEEYEADYASKQGDVVGNSNLIQQQPKGKHHNGVSFRGSPGTLDWQDRQERQDIGVGAAANSEPRVFRKNKALFINQNAEVLADEGDHPGRGETPIRANMKRLLSKDSSMKYIGDIDTITGTRNSYAASQPKNQSPFHKSGSSSSQQQFQQGSALKFLSKKGLDSKSLSTIELIKKLVGENHTESRDFMRDFQADISKREASITDAEVISLAQRSKDVPLLEKGKYVPDQAIVQGATQNPLLANSNNKSQLLLPKMVVDHLQAKKAELERYEMDVWRLKTNTTPKAISQILSQYSSGVRNNAFNGRDSTQSKTSSVFHQSAPNNRKKASKTKKLSTDQDSTPIFTGAQRMNKNGNISPEKRSIILGKNVSVSPAKQKERQHEMQNQSNAEKRMEMQTKAHITLLRKAIKKRDAKQKVIHAMHESRIVQRTLQIVSNSESRANLHSTSPVARSLNRTSSSKTLLPVASSAIITNTDIRDGIVETIHEEGLADISSVKQVAADRRVRALAKQSTWQSFTKNVEDELLIRQESQRSGDIDTGVGGAAQEGGPRHEILKEINRNDSAKRRILVKNMNEQIKIKNLQSTYKLKLASEQLENSQQSLQKYMSSKSPLKNSFQTESELYNQEAQYTITSSPGDSNYKFGEVEVPNTLAVTIDEEQEHLEMSNTKVNSSESILPPIIVTNGGKGSEDDNINQFSDYRNVVFIETSEEGHEIAVPNHSTLRHLVNQRASSQEFVRAQHDVEIQIQTRGHTGTTTLKPDTQYHHRQHNTGLSLAEMVQMQAQHMYYQNQTAEKFNTVITNSRQSGSPPQTTGRTSDSRNRSVVSYKSLKLRKVTTKSSVEGRQDDDAADTQLKESARLKQKTLSSVQALGHQHGVHLKNRQFASQLDMRSSQPLKGQETDRLSNNKRTQFVDLRQTYADKETKKAEGKDTIVTDTYTQSNNEIVRNESSSDGAELVNEVGAEESATVTTNKPESVYELNLTKKVDNSRAPNFGSATSLGLFNNYSSVVQPAMTKAFDVMQMPMSLMKGSGKMNDTSSRSKNKTVSTYLPSLPNSSSKINTAQQSGRMMAQTIGDYSGINETNSSSAEVLSMTAMGSNFQTQTIPLKPKFNYMQQYATTTTIPVSKFTAQRSQSIPRPYEPHNNLWKYAGSSVGGAQKFDIGQMKSVAQMMRPAARSPRNESLFPNFELDFKSNKKASVDFIKGSQPRYKNSLPPAVRHGPPPRIRKPIPMVRKLEKGPDEMLRQIEITRLANLQRQFGERHMNNSSTTTLKRKMQKVFNAEQRSSSKTVFQPMKESYTTLTGRPESTLPLGMVAKNQTRNSDLPLSRDNQSNNDKETLLDHEQSSISSMMMLTGQRYSSSKRPQQHNPIIDHHQHTASHPNIQVVAATLNVDMNSNNQTQQETPDAAKQRSRSMIGASLGTLQNSGSINDNQYHPQKGFKGLITNQSFKHGLEKQKLYNQQRRDALQKSRVLKPELVHNTASSQFEQEVETLQSLIVNANKDIENDE